MQHNGRPLHPDTPSKWFKKFLERRDLPPITLHELRHTNSSLLIAAGIDVAAISERLAHADKSVTLKVYSHMVNKSNKKASDALADKLISKADIIRLFYAFQGNCHQSVIKPLKKRNTKAFQSLGITVSLG